MTVMEDSSWSNKEEHRTALPQQKRSIKRTRTALACARCRQRRTKCSGKPAPCDICRTDGEYCHFHPRLDSRRKDGLSSTEVVTRRKTILHGLLLALRSNSHQDIQDLVKVLRSPNTSPANMARSLREQLYIALGKDSDTLLCPTEDDLLSLVLLDMLSHHKQSSGNMGGRTVLQHLSEVPLSKTVEDQMTIPTAHTSMQTPASQRKMEYSKLGMYSDHGHVLPDHTAVLQTQLIEPPSLLANEAYFVYASSLAQQADASVSENLSEGSRSVCGVCMQSTHSDVSHDFTTSLALGSQSTFNLDFLIISNFSRLCMSFRDSGREILAQGVTVSELIGGERVNCELLFRNRTSEDNVDISNWSCEIARHLPYLPPSTRIAIALCFARMMPYLLLPCQRTWKALPLVLRPTAYQFTHPHDITVAFLPIPLLRDLAAENHVDWLTYASQYSLTLDWPGTWGDVGGALLTEAGNWSYQYQSLRHRKNISFSLQINSEARNRRPTATEMKAILIDPGSGYRFVSEEFERQCWDPKNWRFTGEITKVWPELKNHPPYTQGHFFDNRSHIHI